MPNPGNLDRLAELFQMSTGALEAAAQAKMALADEALDRNEAGATIREIAAELDVPKSTVMFWIKEARSRRDANAALR